MATATTSVVPKEINKGDLLGQGWTEGAIRKFVPPPNIERRSSYERGKNAVCLFDSAAMEAALRKPEVQDYLAKMKARRQKRMARVPQAIPLIDSNREMKGAARWLGFRTGRNVFVPGDLGSTSTPCVCAFNFNGSTQARVAFALTNKANTNTLRANFG